MRIPKKKGAGLDFAGPRVGVVGTGAPRRDDVAADLRRSIKQQRHGLLDKVDALGALFHHHQMALVAHDATDLQSGASGPIGESACVAGNDSAAWQSDIDIDQDVAKPRCGSALDRFFRVDGDGDECVDVRKPPELGPIEYLVCQQEIVAEAGSRHSLDLANRRARECPVAGISQAPCQRSRLESLDVRSQARTRERLADGSNVVIQRVDVDHECGHRDCHGRTVVRGGQA